MWKMSPLIHASLTLPNHRRNRPDTGTLDTQRVRDWLDRTITWPDGVSLLALRLGRFWFGRHAKITAEFELDLGMRGGEVITVMLQGQTIHRPSRKPPRAEAVISDQRLADLRIEDKGLGLHFCTPDRDRALPVLRDLLHRGRTSSLFNNATDARRVVGPLADRPVRFETIAYRIGKRCTLRMSPDENCESPAIFVKVFRRPPSQRLLRAQNALTEDLATRSDGMIATPQVLGSSVDGSVVFTEAITELTEIRPSQPKDLALAARCAASLHAADVTIDRRHTPMDEFGTVCRWVQGLQRLGSARADDFRSLVRAIAPLLPDDLDTSATLIHRDYYCKQLLRREDRIYVTDLDTLCLGDREQDVATFAAHLMLDKFGSDRTTQEATDVAEDFVARYRAHGGVVSSSRLQFYLGCALARLGAIHSARGAPDDRITAMWSTARDVVDGGWSI